MSYVRTPEHRKLRAQLIRQWRPWEMSTGPKSQEGKQKSAQRGFKGNHRGLLRDLRKLLKIQAMSLEEVTLATSK